MQTFAQQPAILTLAYFAYHCLPRLPLPTPPTLPIIAYPAYLAYYCLLLPTPPTLPTIAYPAYHAYHEKRAALAELPSLLI